MSVASWKKVIVSGSNAQLANLSVDQNINATGSVAVGTQGYQYIDATGAATTLSGSFSGSFQGALQSVLTNSSKPNIVSYDVASGLFYYQGTGSFSANSASYASTASYVNTLNQDVIVSGSVSVLNDITASIVHATNNGNGTNFQVGDDAWIGDVNIANTFQVMGQEDSGSGYIKFASGANTPIIGATAGTQVLEVTGSVNVSGSLTAILTEQSSSYLVGYDPITGNLYYEGTGSVVAVTSSYAVSASQAVSSSYALSASYAVNADTASYVNTLNQAVVISGSLAVNTSTGNSFDINADTFIFTGSLSTSGSVSFALNQVNASYVVGYDPVTGLLTYESTGSAASSASYAVSASHAVNADTASYAYNFNVENSLTVSGSSNLSGSAQVTGSLSVGGLNTVSGSSVVTGSMLVTGSTTLTGGDVYANIIFGTQNALIVSGSTSVSGSVGITGSLYVSGTMFGTASLAQTASFAVSASYALAAETASYVQGGTNNYVPLWTGSNQLGSSLIYQTGSTIILNQTNFTTANPEALYVWQPSTSSFNVISGKGDLNNYLQLNIQNTNTGNIASSDIVATANNGDENNYYVDLGINGENYDGNVGYGPGKANDGYVYNVGNDFYIGNYAATQSLYLFNGFQADHSASFQIAPDRNIYISSSLTVTGSLVGLSGFTGSLLGTASNALTASSTLFALSQSTGITPFNFDGSATAAVQVSGSDTLSSGSVTLWTGDAFANSTITDLGNVTINNAGGVLIQQGGLYVTGASTFHDNVVMQGDLIVQGTASFQNTENLAIADQFVLLNSGSSTFQDSGIVINTGNLGNSGSAFFLSTAGTAVGTNAQNGRFAVGSQVQPDATTVSTNEYAVTSVISGSAPGNTVPQFGGQNLGQGNIWVDTSSSDLNNIWIYA